MVRAQRKAKAAVGKKVGKQPPIRLTARQKCVLGHFQREPDDLDRLIATVFGPSMDDRRINPLYNDWPVECFGERPHLDSYLTRYEEKHVKTLRQYIDTFGK